MSEQPTVASALASWLRDLGVRRAFVMHSQYVAPLLPAVWDSGIDLATTASETGAGHMAHGASRAGEPAVAIVGGGPGAGMLLPAVQTAATEGGAFLAIVGQSPSGRVVPFQESGPDGTRDCEILRAAVGDRLFCVDAADGLGVALRGAAAALAAGRAAVLAVPVDVQSESLGSERLPGVAQSWPTSALARLADGSASQGDRPGGDSDVIAYADVLRVIRTTIHAETPVFVDAGQIRHAAHATLDPAEFFDCTETAAMGWAIGAAVGAALATESAGRAPARGPRAIAVSGDASTLMLGNEWATAARYGADVLFVVCVNGAHGGPFVRHRGTQTEELGYLAPVDWSAVALGLGVPAHHAGSSDELARLIAEADPGPLVITVQTPTVDAALSPPYPLEVPDL